MIRASLLAALLCASSAALAQNAATPSADSSATAPSQGAPAPSDAPAAPAQPQIEKIDTQIGTGEEAGIGRRVFVHYTGWFYKPLAVRQRGRKFDSSAERGQPIDFVLGGGQVIKGWDQGVAGMKVGGKRTLIIPWQMAYGKRGAPGGGIPPETDLIFDVELVDVK